MTFEPSETPRIRLYCWVFGAFELFGQKITLSGDTA